MKLNNTQRAALRRMLKLAGAQLGRLAFNANMADKRGATFAEAVRASKERGQLRKDIVVVCGMLESERTEGNNK